MKFFCQSLSPKSRARSSIKHAQDTARCERTKSVLAVCLVLLFLVLPNPVVADDVTADKRIQFNVPEQRIDLALTQFAEQANITLLFPPDEMGDLMANELLGEYSVSAGADILLAGTGLIPTFKNKLVLNIVLDTNSNNVETDMNNREKSKGGLLAAMLSIFGASGAQADAQAVQDAATSGRTLEEVVVYAQKRETLLQTTAIPMTALSGAALKDKGVVNLLDIGGLSPSLTTTVTNGQFIATIRGVGNELIVAGVAEAGVAMHVNGVYLGSLAGSGTNFFDVESMEILRGPQGTLWGRNSTGGAINIIQGRPTEDFEAYIDLSYGNYDTTDIEGAIGGALSDNIQGRLAGKHRSSDGYIENKFPGGDDHGDEDAQSVRGSINIDFGNGASWLLAAGYNNSEINGSGKRLGGTAIPSGTLHPLTADTDKPLDGEFTFAEHEFGPTTPRGEATTFVSNPDVYDDVKGSYFTSQIDIPFSAFDLTILSDIRGVERENLDDIDYTNQALVEDVIFYGEDTSEMSHEIRFTSNSDGDLDWLIGLYYFEQDMDVRTVVTTGPYLSAPDTILGAFPFYPEITFDVGGDLDVTSYAVFGEATYQVTEPLSLTLGLRYSEDEKETDELTRILLGDINGLELANLAGQFEDEWSDITGRLGLQYQLNEDVFLFANIAKGYKSGGINLGSQTGPFDQENLWNYEIGVKSTLLENTLLLNATAFYSDFSGYQLQSVLDLNTIIVNADAEIYGLELESQYLVSDSFRLALTASWNESEITEYEGEGLLNPSTREPVVTGEPLPRTPKYLVRVSADKDFSLGDDFDLLTSLSYNWRADQNLDAYGTFNADQDSYGVLDGFIRLLPASERWLVELWGRNLTDEYYRTSSLMSGATIGSVNQSQIGWPRSYGVRVRYDF